ncbi:Molybdate-transporting ATPase [Bertholletia excelsa]
MELAQTKPDFGAKKTRFRIKTQDLSYKYRELRWVVRWEETNAKSSYILRNVNCEAKPGQITAVAGPSGAGKTTLLGILAGMGDPIRVTGRVLVNDHPMVPAHFRRVSGYVTQDEAMFPLLTVEETLMFSARLRLKGGIDKAKARTTELLKELGLEHVAGARIGDESGRGISGGEKRRVSIGVDLVHDPKVLLIDEPTSGLDSGSALHVILLLKSMAKNQGKTIVLTIHQPGFRILELFDHVVLLLNGTVAHHGSLILLEARLKLAGHSIPRHVTALEFAIDVIESLLVDDFINGHEDFEAIIADRTYDHLGEISSFGYPNSRLNEVLILSQRFAKNVFRTKQLLAARMMQSFLTGILLGTIFVNANKDSDKLQLQTQVGFFAFSLAFLLSPTTEALPIFLEERRILLRETSRGAYRTSSYAISTSLVFLPFLLVVALVYATPVYWIVGLRRDMEAFLYFSLVVWMVVLTTNSLVMCFSALVPDYIMGTTLTAGIMGSFFLFSGYFISKGEIPKYWIFMYYLSLFRYPFECFMINEYGGKGRERCLKSFEGVCMLDGNGFLTQQGLKESQKWSNLVVMVVFIIGYRSLYFIFLWYRSGRVKN